MYIFHYYKIGIVKQIINIGSRVQKNTLSGAVLTYTHIKHF